MVNSEYRSVYIFYIFFYLSHSQWLWLSLTIAELHILYCFLNLFHKSFHLILVSQRYLKFPVLKYTFICAIYIFRQRDSLPINYS